MAYTFTLEAPALELELKKLIVQETEKGTAVVTRTTLSLY